MTIDIGEDDLALTLQTSIQYLKGVGEKRAALYRKLRIETVRDLLYHFPRDYIDLSKPYEICSAPLNEPCAVRARLVTKSGEQRIRKGLSVFKLVAADDSGAMEVTLFNMKFTVDNLQPDREYLFFGRMNGTLLRRGMASPAIYPLPQPHSILPVYAQTAGINSRLMRANIDQALRELEEVPDPLSDKIRRAYSLPSWRQCLQDIHFPETFSQAKAARERFIFEELLVLCCALSSLHAESEAHQVEPMGAVDMAPFFGPLPFRPTDAQEKAINDAIGDMCSSTPMNRLVQGDVGSGKTLVAAACAYFCARNGRQVAMMAPTEILAEQHLATMGTLLEPLGIRTALLTGSTKAAEKRDIKQRLAQGKTDLCIGTHALLTEGVDFAGLGLVITDEQHRFGVAQRAALSQKSENAHVLVMSATPIPRTLSLIIYGDLKLSVIDELPPGRQPIDTLVIGSGKRARALGFIRKHLDAGRQAYIVCPLIEQGEVDTGLRPAVEYAQSLSQKELEGYRLGLLHGKMKPKEKDKVMRGFSKGEIQALVSTTVVEVGVDVPNATIILIENAERFGLSQLHQLRGRVGRGKEKSYCILVSDAKGEKAKGRLETMKKTSDGFLLAEYDLKARGPGDFFGHRQHGLPELRVASLAENMETMAKARRCAEGILDDDPGLTKEENIPLQQAVRHMLSTVGERPN